MRLKSLFLAASLAFTVLATAQTKEGFSVDAVVGINFNKLHAEPTIGATQRPEGKWHGDFRVGVDMHYTFSLPIVISSGLSFARKEFSLKGDVYGRSIREGHFSNLNYLQLPLTVGYNFQLGAFTLRPSVGLVVNYGLSGNLAYTRTQTHPTAWGSEAIIHQRSAFPTERIEVTANMHRFDFAYNVALHAQYKRYGVKVGYERGVTALNTEYTNPYSRGIVVALTHRLF
ncbi:MAG: outer membrane beta-barrel protein [Bacteroidales bacterium]|nr:outer membrane beta-barrel protein [Bacteroidales bacterium]